MLRIASLDFVGLDEEQNRQAPAIASWLHGEDIDVLCCLGICQGGDARWNTAIAVAKELEMASYYVAAGKRATGGLELDGQSGIAILSRQTRWMVGCGTLTLPGDTKSAEPFGQFAFIRDQGNVILVLNFWLAGEKNFSLRQRQLAGIPELSILQRDYAAVVICGNLPCTLTKGFASSHQAVIFSSSSTALHSDCLPEGISTSITILAKRQGEIARLRSRNSRALCRQSGNKQGCNGWDANGLCLDLDITRIPEKDCTHLYRYNSFSRPWNGWQGRGAGCSI